MNTSLSQIDLSASRQSVRQHLITLPSALVTIEPGRVHIVARQAGGVVARSSLTMARGDLVNAAVRSQLQVENQAELEFA